MLLKMNVDGPSQDLDQIFQGGESKTLLRLIFSGLGQNIEGVDRQIALADFEQLVAEHYAVELNGEEISGSPIVGIVEKIYAQMIEKIFKWSPIEGVESHMTRSDQRVSVIVKLKPKDPEHSQFNKAIEIKFNIQEPRLEEAIDAFDPIPRK